MKTFLLILVILIGVFILWGYVVEAFLLIAGIFIIIWNFLYEIGLLVWKALSRLWVRSGD